MGVCDLSRILNVFGLRVPLRARDDMVVLAASGAILLTCQLKLRQWDFEGGVSRTVFICYMDPHLGLLYLLLFKKIV